MKIEPFDQHLSPGHADLVLIAENEVESEQLRRLFEFRDRQSFHKTDLPGEDLVSPDRSRLSRCEFRLK